jgi:hypothetical protein
MALTTRTEAPAIIQTKPLGQKYLPLILSETLPIRQGRKGSDRASTTATLALGCFLSAIPLKSAMTDTVYAFASDARVEECLRAAGGMNSQAPNMAQKAEGLSVMDLTVLRRASSVSFMDIAIDCKDISGGLDWRKFQESMRGR